MIRSVLDAGHAMARVEDQMRIQQLAGQPARSATP
jgi:hypothetical protein